MVLIEQSNIAKLDELDDVDTVSSAPILNHSLIYNGANWVNAFGPIEAAFNGMFLETINFTISEAAGVVTGSLEQDGGGDLIQKFSDGYTTLDCTPAKTVVLTSFCGTDNIPKDTKVYILQSGKTTLVASNSGWPATEHIKIANLFLRSPTTTGTDDGALVLRNWNDHLSGSDNIGHIHHVEERLRHEPTQYDNGIELGLKNAAGAVMNTGDSSTKIEVTLTSGEVYQLHKQTYPAFDMYTTAGDDIHIVNQVADEGGSYKTTIDLVTDITVYNDGSAAGVAISNNRYFSIVIWGVQNRTGQASHVMINIPTGVDTIESAALADNNNYAVYTMADDFRGTGFLIARLVFKKLAGNEWEYIASSDLRGQAPITASATAIDTTHFLLVDGTRALQGAWNMGNNALTNVNIASGSATFTDIVNMQDEILFSVNTLTIGVTAKKIQIKNLLDKTYAEDVSGDWIFSGNILTVQTQLSVDGILTVSGGIGGSSPIVMRDDVNPLTDNTYDLGSTTKGWRDIYLERNIHMGGTPANYRIDVKAGGELATQVFTGAGLDDGTIAGSFDGSLVSDTVFVVKIDGTGTPDTFKWSDDNESTYEATNVAITGGSQTLNNGFTVTFLATTGHTLNDKWSRALTIYNPMWLKDAGGNGLFLVDNAGKVTISVGDLILSDNATIGNADNNFQFHDDVNHITTPVGIQLGIGITPTHALTIGSNDGTDYVAIYHDNSDAWIRFSDGALWIESSEGTNKNTVLKVRGHGTGFGALQVFNEDNSAWWQLTAEGGLGRVQFMGSGLTAIDFQPGAESDIYMFSLSAEGETKELEIYGWRTGDVRRQLEIGVGIDAADTVSFDGLSNYRFDGNILISNGNELRLNDVGNSHYVGFEAPALTATQIWVLPATDGSSGELLSTNGTGTLSWSAAGSAADDTAYNATTWDANFVAATKNAIRDKIETMDSSIGTNTTHRGLTNDPHSVTAAQVGLGVSDNVTFSDVTLATPGATLTLGSGPTTCTIITDDSKLSIVPFGFLGLKTADALANVHLTVDTGVGNTVVEALRISRATSVTAANGIGLAVDYYIETIQGPQELAARMEVVSVVATQGSFEANINFYAAAGSAIDIANPIVSMYGSNLHLMPGTSIIAPAGDVNCFDVGDVSNTSDSKKFKIHRKAAEGDGFFQFYIDQFKVPRLSTEGDLATDFYILHGKLNGVLSLQHTATGDVAMFKSSGSGENRFFRQAGYITAVTDEVDITWQVEDVNDRFVLDRENSNLLGFLIKIPTYGIEYSADPTEPNEGEWVIWMSDGTGKGDDGDVLIASKAGGATTYATLFDKSAGAAW